MLQEFSIGDKIPKSEVKERVKQLYKTLGYCKVPKATDIEEFFEVKVCKIPKPSGGGRDNGYEIIGIK